MARTARQRSSGQGSDPISPPPNQNSKHTTQYQRIMKEAHERHSKLESYLADDENFPTFALQLTKIGLQLRDIPGDGNCLFRALGDQIEGHGRAHFKHRGQIVDYMFEYRVDFEPFVESDIPFTQYLQQLQKLGTYAGNDAIMAFARIHSLNVVIHQLNAPLLIIHGCDIANPRQIHLAYHNGDHYSSVRHVHDNTETPTNIHLQISNSNTSSTNTSGNNQGDGNTGLENHVMRLTGCEDRELVRQSLLENELDPELAISELLQLLQLDDNHNTVGGSTDSGIWSQSGTGTRIFGGGGSSDAGGGARPKHMSKKDRKQERRLESVERHRIRLKQPQPFNL